MRHEIQISLFPRLCFCLLAALLVAFVDDARAVVGAVTPFTSFEGEDGTLGGGASIVAVTAPPPTQYSSAELEASGHAFALLNATGESVTWTNTTAQSFTAINVRACIPDAPSGGGTASTINLYINGVFRQAFSVNSTQSYCYENAGNYNQQTDKNPADGQGRGFWNDTHAFFVGAQLGPGDTLTLQKDASNDAAFYDIDVVDLETPPAPITQPSNSLSIMSYGAVSNNFAFDNTTAINNCFTAAKTQGKTAWIPQGTFYFSAIHGGLVAANITIQGAGAWYSTLYRVTPTNNTQGVANIIETVSTVLRDVSLDCNGSSRAGNNNNGAVNFSGNSWLVDHVWIQHATSAFWCSGVNGAAQNCRILDVWSDGGNFNNVEGMGGVGFNLTYSNNFVRGTGDDAMAINSVNYNTYGDGSYQYFTTMSNISYVNNTAISAWGGKNMSIYGGINEVVTNNLLHDNARYTGLGVGKFGVNGSDLFSATVMGNTVLRCGGNGYLQQQPAVMIGNGGDGQSSGTVANVNCYSNFIVNAMYSGLGFTTGTNILIARNTFINPGQDGIDVGGGSLGTGITGNAIIYSNIVTGLKAGKSVIASNAVGYVTVGAKAAAGFFIMSGVSTQACSEGGADVTSIDPGDWTAYNDITLTNSNTFVARVAGGGSGGTIEVHLDGVAGTMVASCIIPGTGDAQKYVNVYATATPVGGVHAVYLVYKGNGGSLFNVEWFSFYYAPPAASHQLIPGNTYALKSAANGKYVSADVASGYKLYAESAAITPAEEFQIADAGNGNIGIFALATNLYVSAENSGASALVANRGGVGSWETFTEVDAGGGRIGIQAQINHKYVTVGNSGTNALIASQSAVGTNESFYVEFVTGVPPNLPSNLVATAGNASVLLNWTPSLGASGYNLKRSTTSGSGYTPVVSNWTGLSYTNTGLVNGTTYFYVVSAVNLSGESTNSPQVAIVPGTVSRLGWAGSSSTSGNDLPGYALDGDLSTRWSTGTGQTPGQWFQVDMGAPHTFNKLILNAATSTSDYPRGYTVSISTDGINWSNPIASGAGAVVTTITFPAQTARYIRVTQTGSAGGSYWSIHEFNVFAAAPLPPTGLTASAASASEIDLSWNASVDATGYNLKRSTASGSGYSTIGTNLSGVSYANIGVSAGNTYYYVVTATNAYGESGTSGEVNVSLVSPGPVTLNFNVTGNQVQFNWPGDHIGWQLQTQVAPPGTGIGTNWAVVPNSTLTNQVTLPMNLTNGSVFYRLASP